QSNPSTLVTVQTDPAVKNEFGVSNTVGTIAMAKQENDPNSATSEFFFNLRNNSSNLDNQNGGFPGFGKILGPSEQQIINALSSLPDKNESSFNSALDTIPLSNYNGTNFPTDTVANNYALIKDVAVVKRDEFLTYSVVSNTNQGLVSASVTNNRLVL